STDSRAVSAGKTSDHHARSTRDSGGANCLGKNAKNVRVLRLLLRFPLVAGRAAGLTRGAKRNFRNRHPLRGSGRGSSPADATRLRLPRTHLRSLARLAADNRRYTL